MDGELLKFVVGKIRQKMVEVRSICARVFFNRHGARRIEHGARRIEQRRKAQGTEITHAWDASPCKGWQP